MLSSSFVQELNPFSSCLFMALTGIRRTLCLSSRCLPLLSH